MQDKQQNMKPHDLAVLLRIAAYGQQPWSQISLAQALCISQSEVSKSLNRSKNAGLLDPSGKIVMRRALFEFLQYGLRYAFPQKPGALVRGVATSHSASPLKEQIQSNEDFVWPFGKGNVRGQSIVPLYPTVPQAVLKDQVLHKLLALVDALRVGRARERELALVELKHQLDLGE